MRAIWPATLFAVAQLLCAAGALAHDPAHDQAATKPPPEMRLPVIGPAPDFDLTSQDGKDVSLADYRGKVTAVTFIFTECPDICPMLTSNMAQVQQLLGTDFGKTVAFVSITIDPETDTPPVLKEYAEAFGANLEGWAFLTGDPAALHEVSEAYGVFAEKAVGGGFDHTLLTSIIDPHGVLRVQYIGYRFDLEEFRGDLLSLVGEAE
jgi:protein SCO1/2